MPPIHEKLTCLLSNFFQVSKQALIAAYIFDRDGLLIANQSRFERNSREDSEIYGAIASVVDPTLKRITAEYPGSFGTGGFETEDHHLIFTEAGPKAILLCVYEYRVIINYEMPYVFLVAEKIAKILEDPKDDVSLSVPNLHVGEGLPQISLPQLNTTDKSGAAAFADEQNLVFKLCVLGDPAVGKTSLIHQFVTKRFEKDYKPTLGIAITNRRYNLQGFENKVLDFMIWDLAGQKFFQRVRQYYYTGANAAFIMYDISRRESFEGRIKYWYKDIRKAIPDIPIVIVGNKLDLLEKRQVKEEEGLHLAKELKCSFLETSAKSGENVKDAFSLMGIGLFFNFRSKEP
ncbi:GTP-binding protein [Candidatus Lokiarchaeum ossiferum]|uniref:GTP-binding protein n=1 Tax=Candidatus Lokiarchaeum ossiferum TaxID=2951803 RepID=UPI00352CA2B1